jgi:DNA-binding transcriptional regulator/RsmH inhibitor MraZ
MQAIEFKATIHNGIVTLPSQYKPQLEGKTIRIIVLDDSELPITMAPAPRFQAIALRTQGFKFNRAEANER